MLMDVNYRIYVLRFPGQSYALIVGSPWWWRQYTSLKRRSTSTTLHGAISQKTNFYAYGNYYLKSHKAREVYFGVVLLYFYEPR